MINMITKVFKSRTLIVNWSALIAATLTLWLDAGVIAEYPEVAGVLTSVLAGVNVVLRFLTTEPLEDK